MIIENPLRNQYQTLKKSLALLFTKSRVAIEIINNGYNTDNSQSGLDT